MIDHVTISVRNFEASRRFYDAALAPLGYARLPYEGPAASYESPDGRPEIQIVERGEPSTRLHIAIKAADRAAVHAFHDAAITVGGTSNGAPGVRSRYHADYYAAFVLDPDGNNVEAVCQVPPA